MSILRLFVAWLVMAALPLQGLAAASMLYCDQAAHRLAAASSAHDHDGEHGHAAHGAKSHVHAEDSLPADSGGHHAGAAQTGTDSVGSADNGVTDDGHGCPICAACCNLVVLSSPPVLSLGADAPALLPSQGASRVITRSAPTPDKPPRA